MQLLTAAPRDDLTTAQMTRLLTGSPMLTVRRGLQQLDRDLRPVADLSSQLQAGTVSRSNYADEHGDCLLRLNTELTWHETRLQPYVTLDDGTVEARVNLGVYVPTRPKDALGVEPATFDVTCRDLLSLLRRQVETDYSVAAGAGVLAEVTGILTTLGFTGALFDQTGADKVLPAERSWVVSEDEIPTWLRIINDLLASIGYRALWFDENGRPRSGPYQAPSDRPSEWTFDYQAAGNVVAARVEREVEAGEVPNVWRFIRRDYPGAVVGDGIYEVENADDGPTSIAAVGRVPSTRYFDAVDQPSLEVQGNRAVASDRRLTTLYRVRTSPFPLVGHFDVYTYADTRLHAVPQRVLARSWRVDLGNGDTEHVWEAVA